MKRQFTSSRVIQWRWIEFLDCDYTKAVGFRLHSALHHIPNARGGISMWNCSMRWELKLFWILQQVQSDISEMHFGALSLRRGQTLNRDGGAMISHFVMYQLHWFAESSALDARNQPIEDSYFEQRPDISFFHRCLCAPLCVFKSSKLSIDPLRTRHGWIARANERISIGNCFTFHFSDSFLLRKITQRQREPIDKSEKKQNN